MPVYHLSKALYFPHPSLASSEGIVAVGGDLSVQRLYLAYMAGIFPWYNGNEPILWWSPDPRFILYPTNLKVSKSMRQVFKSGRFRITYDRSFREVMRACAKVIRKDQQGTWINEEMIDAYSQLYQLGLAHSVEVWENDQLVGGLYGVSLGRCFFGESMFALAANASKTGFITLVRDLESMGFSLIDCQIYTDHLASLGATEIPREHFLEELASCMQYPDLRENWGLHFNRM